MNAKQTLVVRARSQDNVHNRNPEIHTSLSPVAPIRGSAGSMNLGVLCYLLASLVLGKVFAADESVPVRAGESQAVLTLENGLVEVRYDRAEGTFTAAAGKVAFIRRGQLSDTGGRARIVSVSDALGDGKAIEVRHRNGNADRIALYPGLRFVCLRTRLLCPGNTGPLLIDKITPTTVTIDLEKKPKALRVLGCDGLTAADENRISWSFLAIADPASRNGVVAGWLTHNRGSGVVASHTDPDGVRIAARCEYGKLAIAPGKTAEGETFAIGHFDRALAGLEAYGNAIAQANRIQLTRPIPSGYCTWYSRPHGGASDEKHMAQLADFCGEQLTKFGFEVLQIDDRWQISGRDFTTHKPGGPFPSGMKTTADKIQSLGMTAGIWFIPFGWDPTRPIFRDHQDWFVRNTAGELYKVHWAGTCLDMTHPDARKFLGEVVSRMTRQWGYKYIKIDGLWTGMAAKILYPNPAYRNDNLGDAVFHDPAKTNVEAYRDGLKLVREAAGDDVFILGCNIAQNMRTMGASFGLVDGMRVGRDIGARWGSILPSAEMGSRLYFFHGRVWYNDPDCLMVRAPMTLEQARAWGSWIALSGQLNLVSEWLPGLPPERLEIVKRSMPNHGLCGRPVDLFESALPQVWQLTAERGNVRRDVIGLFNWKENEPDTLSVDLERLDLPGGGKGTYVGFDYWANRFHFAITDRLELALPPGSCRIIAIRPMRSRPQIISTSRHITQGIIDVTEETWDAAANALNGSSRVVTNDSYEIRIIAPTRPTDWKAVSAEVSDMDRKAGVTMDIRQSGSAVRATITSETSREVHWKVRFKPGPASAPKTGTVPDP